MTAKTARTLRLELGERSYTISIGPALLDQAVSLTPLDLKNRNVFILADKAVGAHLPRLEKKLHEAAREVRVLSIDAGEPAKSFAGLQKVTDWLLENGAERSSVLYAFGGGVIGDLGGFAASVTLRGIPYVQVPTTLLAQVDSSVGGKTGINTAQGKNLIGTFYQPAAVICDTGVLSTLPLRERQAGYAEIAKYGLIDRPEFFEWLEGNGGKVIDLDPASLAHAVETSCAAKAAIVSADERESSGARALLNLGHTFGHALEAAAAYDGRLLHGEAVSIGMTLAFALSARMKLCAGEDAARVKQHLSALGLKTSLADISPALFQSAEDLFALMQHDKKSSGGVLAFILARGIGKAFVSRDVRKEDVIAVIEDSFKG